VVLSVKELMAAGLYDPQASDAEQRLDLLRVLERRGAGLAEMTRAHGGGRLQRLAAELLVYGDVERLTADEVSTQAGVEVDRFKVLWRAAGFPEPAPDDSRFTQAEVELVRVVERARALFGEPATLQLVRVVGSSVARIAEAAVSTFMTTLGAPLAGTDSSVELAEANETAIELFEPLAAAMAAILGQHLVDAARPTISDTTAGFETVAAAVGFVDVVGSTALSMQRPLGEIGLAIEAFEQRAADAVVGANGRVVKFIGDEVMFEVGDPAVACDIALEIVGSFADDDVLPGARAAVAFGGLLARDGDFFGPVVNLAARAAKLATPGCVVASEAVRAAVSSSTGLIFDAMPARAVDGFDDLVELFTVARASSRTEEE
jgi:adenylate cyclase